MRKVFWNLEILSSIYGFSHQNRVTHPQTRDVKQRKVNVLRVGLEDLFIEVVKDRLRHHLLQLLVSVRVFAELRLEISENFLHAHVERFGHGQLHLLRVLIVTSITVIFLRLLDLLARDIHVDEKEILEDQFQHVVHHIWAVVEHLEEVVDVGDDLEVRLFVVGKLDADLLPHRHRHHRHHVERLFDEIVHELQLRVEMCRGISARP